MFAQSIRTSVTILAIFTVMLGGIYPALVYGAGKLLFNDRAEGSLIRNRDGVVIGSSLIGQSFSDPSYFWGRLSATGPVPYNAGASSGSNLGPAAPNLAAAVKARIEALRLADPANKTPIPVDLVTASGSGLDPDISVAAANYQSARIARARGMGAEQVKAVIHAATQRRQFGVFGQERVNVLQMNRALDGLSQK